MFDGRRRLAVAVDSEPWARRFDRGAMALWGFVILVASLHVLAIFASTTLGVESGPFWVFMRWALGVDRNLDFSSYSAMQALSLLATPAILRRALSKYRAVGLEGALLTIAAMSLPLVLALSYRFAALLASLGFAVALLRRVEVRGTRVAWLSFTAACLLALAPLDVSLRVKPLGPRVARAVEGLPGPGLLLADASGEAVILGCNAMYRAPAWVWVW